ncbi:MAG: Lrp/AsnC ligand binding domain-containing protein [Chitinophagales bacterium]|nr:Lrp/AsnC ligand binding domain-containing protein [Bacteroidota bacterium]MBX7140405.1 Lrp/AsnC ligand binding domain-containing protein [Chitinophagales bacterium]
MPVKLDFDKLDLQIIGEMMKDASASYKVLGKKLFVSAGTIHVRMKKLQRLGVLSGSSYHINLKKIGYDITAFIGIYLEKSSLYATVAKDLKKIPEIVRLNYTTGNYSMFAEIVCRDMEHLRLVLYDKLQHVRGIERTETLISLDESFKRSAEIL